MNVNNLLFVTTIIILYLEKFFFDYFRSEYDSDFNQQQQQQKQHSIQQIIESFEP